MLGDFIKPGVHPHALTKLAALVAMPVLKRFKARVDHRRYNGAALLGLRGLVFKSHGSADAFAFEHALTRAYDAARNRLLDRVHDASRNTHAHRRCRWPTSRHKPPDESHHPPTLRYTRITGTGSYLPPRRVSNADLAAELAERGVETSDDWIVERTGIRARHFADRRRTPAIWPWRRRAPRCEAAGREQPKTST
jgi:hypothetical protein